MAGDWIKMRGGLLNHPKVISMARKLHDNKDFREWLTPGGSGTTNGQIISDGALRCVTTALLLKVWSVAREHGKFVGDDLVLDHSVVLDLDQISGVSGFGEAMESVGWAKFNGHLVLPNFIEFNVPLTNAEKQKEYRERKKTSLQTVTNALPTQGNGNSKTVTTREEKRREDKDIPATKTKAKKAPPPEHWSPSESCVARLTAQYGFVNDDAERYTQAFIDACEANGYTYLDFDAAFSNCVRQDWPKFRNGARTMPKQADPNRPNW